MDDVLAKKVEKISKKGIKYRARTCEFDHIIAVNNRLPGRRDPLAAPFKLEEMPGRDDDGRPNRAARLLSRREHLQFMMKEDNAAKGSSISEHMIEDFRTFERCFYSHNQLKNDDVLARRYLPEPTILANVTAWAAERRAKLGGWYGIGDPAEPV